MAGQANVEVLVNAVTEAAEESLEEVGESLEDTGESGEAAAGGMETAADAADDAGDSMASTADDADDLSDGSQDAADSLFDLDAGAAAAAGGLAAAGTAMQGMFNRTQDTRESLGRTAATLGFTRDETEDLATSLTDATFPLEDATATLDSLARQGVDTEEDLQNVAMAMDNVADATGSSAESISDSMGPALRAFGHDLEDADEQMDTFTFVARNTTQDVEGFAGTVERLAPELQEMGLSLDETAAIMAALEEEGITGRQAIQEFRQATREAEGDQAALTEELGLSEDAIREQEQALADSEGITREHADAANESLTRMDELKASFDDFMLSASSTMEPLNALAPAMQAVGIAGIAMSTINFSAVIPSIMGVMTALAPVLPILLAVAAAAGILYVAWDQNLGGMQDKAQELMDLLDPLFRDLMGIIRWFTEQASRLWERFGGQIMTVADFIFGTIFTIIMVNLDTYISIIRAFFAILTGDFEEAGEIIEGLLERTFGRVEELFEILGVDITESFENTKERLVGIGESVKQFFIELWEDLKDMVPSAGDLMPDMPDVPGSGLAGDAAGAVGSAAGSIPGLAEGGRVAQTGLALVHEGESFIPDDLRPGDDGGGGGKQPQHTENNVNQDVDVNVDVGGDLGQNPFRFSRDLADQVVRETRRSNGT